MLTRAKKVNRKQRARTQKRTPGRPTKYNSKIAKTIFKHVSEGVSREGSASLAGINPDTLYDWQRKYPEFSDLLQRADAKFERAAIRSISRAGKRPRHWTASAWSLERKFPNRYGKIDRHVIESKAMQVAPTKEYIAAINRALGIYPGAFVPLHEGKEEQKTNQQSWPPSRMLPESTDSQDENRILEDGLPCLP